MSVASNISIVVGSARGAQGIQGVPGPVGVPSAPIVASENLTGPLVNIWNNASVVSARNANGSTVGKEAHGYIVAPVAAGQMATIYFAGVAGGFTGLTGGAAYLSASAGLATSTPLSTPGQTSQVVGVAVSATALNFAPETPVGL